MTKYERWTLWISGAAVVVAGLTCEQQIELQRQQQEFELSLRTWEQMLDQANLVHNEPSHEPQLGRPGPYMAAIFNRGKQQALIVRVDFEIIKKLQTPKKYAAGGVDAYSLSFKASDYVEAEHRFSVWLKKPIGIDGGQNALLYVEIVEPNWVGTSYTGNLIIHYDRGEPLRITNVTLDCLLAESNFPWATPVR